MVLATFVVCQRQLYAREKEQNLGEWTLVVSAALVYFLKSAGTSERLMLIANDDVMDGAPRKPVQHNLAYTEVDDETSSMS